MSNNYYFILFSMIMKSIWDKASELGSKAKNIASDYLQKEEIKKPRN